MPATTQIIYVGQGFMLSVETVGSMTFNYLITFDDAGFKVQGQATSGYGNDFPMREYEFSHIESVESTICRKDVPVQYIILD